MRKARFAEGQIIAIIREADREPVSVVAKRHEVSEQTIYTWRKRFGGFQANEVRRLKQLETENARLKKLVAERDLEIEIMKKVGPLLSDSVLSGLHKRPRQAPLSTGQERVGRNITRSDLVNPYRHHLQQSLAPAKRFGAASRGGRSVRTS
jgi:putative transposase